MTHRMSCEATYPGEVLLTCHEDGCGRRVVVRPGSMVVLDRGDFFASHVGGSDGIAVRSGLT